MLTFSVRPIKKDKTRQVHKVQMSSKCIAYTCTASLTVGAVSGYCSIEKSELLGRIKNVVSNIGV